MSSLLFLLPGVLLFAVALAHAFFGTRKTKKVLKRFAANKKNGFSGGAIVERVVLFAQISEFAQLVTHATVVNIVVIVILTAIWLALRAGTEGESY